MSESTMPAAAMAAATCRTRIVWTPAERSEWLRMFEASGKSVSEFCRENDLPEATLSLWRQKPRSGEESAVEDGGFVEIPAARLNPSTERTEGGAALTVRFSSGWVLEFAALRGWLACCVPCRWGPEACSISTRRRECFCAPVRPTFALRRKAKTE